MPTTALRAGSVLAAVALSLTAAPALAHEAGGDNATNVRGLAVATEGDATNMSYVANLQYQQPTDTDGDGQADPVDQGGATCRSGRTAGGRTPPTPPTAPSTPVA